MNGIYKAIVKLFLFVFVFFCLFLFIRIFLCDRVTVRGESMVPTFSDGDRIYINKLILGARIYTDYQFDKKELHCFRMPGIRSCRTDDIVVFNYPFGIDGSRYSFIINQECVKRCFAVPGDTLLMLRDSILNVSQIGVSSHVRRLLRESKDSLFFYRLEQENSITSKDTIIGGLYVVPKKGKTVLLDSLTLKKYAKLIEYENNNNASCISIGESYCFRENWYFFVGDNRKYSTDSRHFGPIPEKYIIGVISPYSLKYHVEKTN